MTAPRVTLIDVPYDSGSRDVRHGGGPAALLAGGAAERLAGAGPVERASVAVETDLPFEVGTGAAVMRAVAEHVRDAAAGGSVPVVLAGNCGVTVGVTAGLRAAGAGRVGVLWFDAHGDLHTPSTSTSGFVDGMGLAVLTGRCWEALAATVPGFAPLPDDAVALVGGYDLDDAERRLLDDGGPALLSPTLLRTDPDAARAVLAGVGSRVDALHIHVDLDVYDTAVAPANSYAVPGGFTATEVRDLVTEAARHARVASATIASWDPSHDPAHRLRDVALDLLELVGGLARPASEADGV